jgi:hypothetical protein
MTNRKAHRGMGGEGGIATAVPSFFLNSTV